MMDKTRLEEALTQLPLYAYAFLTPEDLEFSERIRFICKQECPMYGKSWACPPGVGEVSQCEKVCMGYQNCLLISTITEVQDIASIEQTLATRPAHEEITNRIQDLFLVQGIEPYVLSTEACAICEHCAYLDGKPCIHPQHMHPCVESHGINLLPLLEQLGLPFQYGENVVTWFSLLFYNP